jgi:glutamate-1-semialdehyde 2,1-aminomutase
MVVNKQFLQARYENSMDLLARACRVSPTGSQTFSKSLKHYPAGASPLFLTRGRGSHVWDVDGNEYIDFISSLATINLGHGDPDIIAAVQEQLRDGVIFSLPHPLEIQVAEKMRDMIPCAEMVRFAKNGSDATSGAIRLARAYTGRDHVLVCGYHGWQDWYIGSTSRHRGVPRVVRDLTHTFVFNDIESVQRLFREYAGQVAAVILEPMNTTQPKPEFLGELKELTHRNGTLLIFDEMVTGFRFARGGAQEKFGVIPDLACFGKAMANGFPISAIAGKAEIMSVMADIFVSLTYGGEVLSLAAALAAMTKIQRMPIIESMHRQGERVMRGVQGLIEAHGVSHFFGICGSPTWSFLTFADAAGCSQWEIKTLFLQEVLARGVLTMGLHIMSYAHGDAEVRQLLKVYDEVLPILKKAVDGGGMGRLLITEALEPVFKVR